VPGSPLQCITGTIVNLAVNGGLLSLRRRRDRLPLRRLYERSILEQPLRFKDPLTHAHAAWRKFRLSLMGRRVILCKAMEKCFKKMSILEGMIMKYLVAKGRAPRSKADRRLQSTQAYHLQGLKKNLTLWGVGFRFPDLDYIPLT
jgi:hypothetical protein